MNANTAVRGSLVNNKQLFMPFWHGHSIGGGIDGITRFKFCRGRFQTSVTHYTCVLYFCPSLLLFIIWYSKQLRDNFLNQNGTVTFTQRTAVAYTHHSKKGVQRRMTTAIWRCRLTFPSRIVSPPSQQWPRASACRRGCVQPFSAPRRRRLSR